MNFQNKKTLQVFLVVLIAIVTLSIGYASISAINLIISGNATASVNDNNFKVYFVPTSDTPSITKSNESIMGSASISNQDNTKAEFDVSGLTKVGDYAIATYTVLNNSNGVGTEISLELTNSNPDYFKVTESVMDNKLQAGDTTPVLIVVEMIKTPIDNDVSTRITGTIKAKPLENDSATGGGTKEKIDPIPYVYTLSSNNINNSIVGNSYTNFNAAKIFFGHPATIAHILNGNIIKESYVAFEKNGVIYYLRGGEGNGFGQDSMPIYDYNVNTLKTAFGENWESYCAEDNYDEEENAHYRVFHCDAGYLYTYASTNGEAGANGIDNWNCSVYSNGNSYCNAW